LHRHCHDTKTHGDESQALSPTRGIP
jgi:hypothetical protein